jgi:hypothetical protein
LIFKIAAGLADPSPAGPCGNVDVIVHTCVKITDHACVKITDHACVKITDHACVKLTAHTCVRITIVNPIVSIIASTVVDGCGVAEYLAGIGGTTE